MSMAPQRKQRRGMSHPRRNPVSTNTACFLTGPQSRPPHPTQWSTLRHPQSSSLLRPRLLRRHRYRPPHPRPRCARHRPHRLLRHALVSRQSTTLLHSFTPTRTSSPILLRRRCTFTPGPFTPSRPPSFLHSVGRGQRPFLHPHWAACPAIIISSSPSTLYR